MASQSASIIISPSNNFMMPGSAVGDMMHFVKNPTSQRILLGASNSAPWVAMSASNIAVAAPTLSTSNVSVTGALVGASSNLSVAGNATVSSNLTVTGNINFIGNLTQNGTPFVSGGGGSSSVTIDSNNNPVLSTTIAWSTVQPAAQYFPKQAMAIDGNNTGVGLGIALDTASNLLVAGTYNATAPTIYNSNATNSGITLPANLGSNAAFAVKYATSTGTAQWAVAIDGAGVETATSVATDTSNNVLVAGSYTTSNVALYNASGSSNTGLPALPAPSNASSAAYVVKYDANGTPQWATLVDSVGTDSVNAVKTDASNNVYLAGIATGSNPAIYDAASISVTTSYALGAVGEVTTVAGSGDQTFANGTGSAASFYSPCGVAVDSSGNVYVADYNNHRIRKITAAGVVTTLAGSGVGTFADGTGTAASFYNPNGVAVDSSGNVYVADWGNNRIRKITPAGVVTTFAGSGSYSFADGTGTAASFKLPFGVAVDSSGNVYVADSDNHRIRKITPAGVVTTLAGSGNATFADGTGTAASFYGPRGLAVDSSGNVYVAEYTNHRIRKITPAGAVTTLAGSGLGQFGNGTGTAASFRFPSAVAVDSSGNVYVADTGNHRIRKITSAGVVTTLAGAGYAGSEDGTGTAASFYSPSGVAVDSFGNIYVADQSNNRIRRIELAGAEVTTLAGSGTANFADGTGLAASFNNPQGVAVDSSNNVYIGDTTNNRICKITPAGVVTTLAGSGSNSFADGTGAAASFRSPIGVAVDSSGNVYVGDADNHRIRKITPAGVVTTFAGSGSSSFADGTGTAASFNNPRGIAVDSSGNFYVADNGNNRIRKITPAGVVTTLAGSGSVGSSDGTGTAASFSNPFGVAVDLAGNVYVGDYSNNRIRKITPAGAVTTLAGSGTGQFADGTGTAASFNSPYGVAVDLSGNVYVADQGNRRIRKITAAGVVTTVAGTGLFDFANGTGTLAHFKNPSGVAIDSQGNIYIADQNNHRIREISAPVAVSTFAGSGAYSFADGTGPAASFNSPYGLARDAAGNFYTGDQGNNRIRKITPAGVVTTLAGSGNAAFADGTGTAASFNGPLEVAVDSSGNVYVADQINHRIRKITPAGVVTTLAGSGTGQFADGTGTAASFNNPYGIAVDSSGNVYVGDLSNNRIRKITPAGVVTTLAGSGTGQFADGTGTAASFWNPRGLAVDSSGNVYVADRYNNRVRKITPAGVVTTLAASLNAPFCVTLDSSGNVYVGDNSNLIYKITPAGLMTTLAGSGAGALVDDFGLKAAITPRGMTVDTLGNIYVADNGSVIRKLSTLIPTASGSSLTVSASVSLFSSSNNQSAFALKYNSTGTSQWSVTVDGSSPDSAAAIATDPSLNVYVAGRYGPNAATIYANQTPSAISTLAATSGNAAAFAIKVGSNGTPLWAVRVDGTGTEEALGAAVDTTGSLYIAGTHDAIATFYSSNNTAFATTLPAPSNKSSFLAKYDTNGAAQWVTRIHGLTNSNIATSLALDSSNNIYLAGSYGGSQTIFNTAGAASPLTLPTTLNNGSNMAAFCIKYSSAGLPLNTWVLGGLSNAQNNAITVDSTGSNIYTTGFFTNSNTTLYDGNQMTSSIIFPSGISTQAAFVTNYTQQFSSFYLPSSLGNAANGQQKYVTNVGNAAITLNVTNSNMGTILSSNTINPNASTLYNWYGGTWYKII